MRSSSLRPGCARGTVPAAALGAMLLCAAALPAERGCGKAPQRLSQTGLYADMAAGELAPGVLAFEPQYPLWTDGAAKRRWIRLPPGAAIDASDPDAWRFPVGTRLWKEFAFGGRVETRMMERVDGKGGPWLYATYAWLDDQADAVLVPDQGRRNAARSASGEPHDLPSVYDCRACHDGPPSAVLGFSALQLSPDRDPLAPHASAPSPGAVDLRDLLERGLLRNFPAELAGAWPRIAAATPRERAALGYLHGNCGGCHASGGPLASLGMALDYRLAGAEALAPALRTAVGHLNRVPLPDSQLRIAPGDPEHSSLTLRLGTRNPLRQMPPLGTRSVDREALDLISAWIREDLPSRALAPCDNP